MAGVFRLPTRIGASVSVTRAATGGPDHNSHRFRFHISKRNGGNLESG